MSSLKESDEYHEFQDIYKTLKNYVLNGGLKTYLLGTKKELMKAPHDTAYCDWTPFDGVALILEAASIPQLENVANFYRGLVGLDLTLRFIRMFDEENERIGPGIIGSGREFLDSLLENRNRKR